MTFVMKNLFNGSSLMSARSNICPSCSFCGKPNYGTHKTYSSVFPDGHVTDHAGSFCSRKCHDAYNNYHIDDVNKLYVKAA